MNPFFSIIIPTYNAGTLLPKAMDSILEQTFQNYEVIVMDGLSKDSTIAIAKRYSEKDSRINIFSQADKGIYDAMNKSIIKARGAYLFFLGSDDTFHNESVLLNVFNEIKDADIDVLYGCISSSTYGNKYDGAFTYEKLINKNIGHQAIFFKNTVFDVVGNFNLKYKALADWDHNIRWFFNNKLKYKYIDLVISDFNDGGFSSTYVDVLFEEDRPYKILSKGWNKLKQKDIIKIAIKARMIAKSKNNYSQLFQLNVLLLFFKIRNRLG